MVKGNDDGKEAEADGGSFGSSMISPSSQSEDGSLLSRSSIVERPIMVTGW